jgi:hypothetical protein
MINFLFYTFKQPLKALVLAVLGLIAATLLVVCFVYQLLLMFILIYCGYLSLAGAVMLGSYFKYRTYKDVEFNTKMREYYSHQWPHNPNTNAR